MNLNTQRVLTVFAIVMITVTSVDSIRNLPATALFGSKLIFFFLAAAVLFLLPAALVSAELASKWPHQGGVYVWVKEAFGLRAGFLAIWFQWVENVIWYPTILSFLAGTFAYLLSPELANNKYYLTAVIWIVFWATTYINYRGMKVSAWFSIVFGIAGLVIPMTIIIVLGIIWMVQGKPIQIDFSWHNLLPDFSDPTLLVSLTGVILSYSGIEIATVHAREAKNPQRDYPRALILSTVIIASTLILGSLAIAIIVPQHQLNLVSGIMQAFVLFLNADHISWMVPVIAGFIILGALASISNWTIAPIKGLLVAAQDGCLPPMLQRENRYAAPSALLIIQAILVSLVAAVFIFMPTINSSYWLLTVVAAQLYMFMYILMFAAGIRLRYKHPGQQSPFQIAGGKFGMWLIAGIGLASAVFTVIIGFAPPAGVKIGSLLSYESLIVGLLLVMSIPPFIIYRCRRPEWQTYARELEAMHQQQGVNSL